MAAGVETGALNVPLRMPLAPATNVSIVGAAGATLRLKLICAGPPAAFVVMTIGVDQKLVVAPASVQAKPML